MRFFIQLQDFMFYAVFIAIASVFLIQKYVRGVRKSIKMLSEPEGSCEPGAAYRTFAAMADELGPIFSIRLGTHRNIVVSSWEIAKDCLNSFGGLKAQNSVTTLGSPVSTELCFVKIVNSLRKPSRNNRGGGAISSTCSAIAEIFRIAAIIPGLVLVGVAVGYVLLRIESSF